MQRRKYLAAVGSLAAGGAAMMGTGAFSQSELRDRPVSAAVVNDANGFVGLLDNDSGLPNDEYATYENGKLKLAFDGSSLSDPEGFVGGSGNGLNTESTYFFDGVFGVASKSEEKISPQIDWSGLDNPGNFVFYATAAGGRPDEIDPSEPYTVTAGDVPGGAFTDIGVGIKVPNTLDSGWEKGSISLTITSQG